MERIFIPTYRRVAKQVAFKGLTPELRAKTTFFVDEEDRNKLLMNMRNAGLWIDGEDGTEMVVCPPEITSIAKKRHYMLGWAHHEGYQKIVQIDDDVLFYQRTYPPEKQGKPSLPKATPQSMNKMFAELFEKLDDYVHAGFPMRQMHQARPDGWHEIGRQCFLLGYHVPTAIGLLELGRIEHREDMDYTLQLLRKGFPNALGNDYAVGQAGYNSKGGASVDRTMEASNADAELLAELHPGFVKVRETDYVGSINRKEVTVQWKKAYESSKG